MTIRELRLPQDLAELAPMLADSFQYPENPDWSVQEDERETLVHDINSLARSWWMIKLGQVFIPAMRELLPGMVWVEDNRIAGMVLVQRRGSSHQWVVGTVATRPEYRRRGIARQLVQAGLEYIRNKNGNIAILDVIDANLPAYKLYQSLGFEHFSGTHILEYSPRSAQPAPQLDPAYQLQSSNIFNWAPRYHLMQRIAPASIQTYEPVEEGQFRQPGYMRLVLPLISRAQQVRQNIVFVHHLASQQIVGYLMYDIRSGGRGRHSIGLRLDPVHANLAPQMVSFMLHQVTAADPTLSIEANLPAWQQHSVEAALNLGFEKRMLYHRMGLKLS